MDSKKESWALGIQDKWIEFTNIRNQIRKIGFSWIESEILKFIDLKGIKNCRSIL